MASMLDYIDQLNELDTTGVEPMSHVFPIENVMREDVVTNGDESEKKHFSTHLKEKTRHLLYQKLLNRKERPWDCWI